MMKNNDHVKNLEQKREHNERYKQGNGPKVFKYQQEGNILSFEFTMDKRIKCPNCKKEFKNLQRSSCEISNIDDLSEKLKQFKKVHFADQLKEDQNKWKAQSRAKQREIDDEKVKDDQNKRKAKSRAKQREIDDENVKDDQIKLKAKSRAKQREIDDEKVKDDQVKWKAKSVAKQREDDDQQVKNYQNKRKAERTRLSKCCC